MTMAAAAIDPVGSSNCEAPVKFAMAAGAVMERSVDVSEIANNRSFQQKMNTRMPAVTMPGAASGATTFRNACPGVAPRLARALGELSQIQQSAQRIIRDLRPPILDAGLVAALQWHTAHWAERQGVAMRFACSDPLPKLPAKEMAGPTPWSNWAIPGRS